MQQFQESSDQITVYKYVPPSKKFEDCLVLDGLEEGLKVALKSLRMVLNDIDDG